MLESTAFHSLIVGVGSSYYLYAMAELGISFIYDLHLCKVNLINPLDIVTSKIGTVVSSSLGTIS